MATIMNEPRTLEAAEALIAKNPCRRGPILLATDVADPTDDALRAAASLATHLDVPLDVVSVLEPLYLAGGAIELAPIYGFELDLERRNGRERLIREYVTKTIGSPPHNISVRFGSIAYGIADEARERQATMIVMSAGAHRRRRHYVAGQLAARVLRQANCPVLSVAGPLKVPLSGAVVGIDFGPSSVRAAQAALLLLSPSATLTLTHVAQGISDLPRSRFADSLQESTHTLFERVRAVLRPNTDSVRIETRVVDDGILAAEILDTADRVSAPLVAVGTQGPGLIARLFGGSVAAGVLHGSEVSVLASPPPTPAEALELRLRVAGTAQTTDSVAWSSALDAFSVRNVGRRVVLEVDDPDVGAQVDAGGYVLGGVTYDPHDECVEVMLGDAKHPLNHLTRSVRRPDAIAISTHAARGEEAIEIRHGKGHTVILVLPDSPQSTGAA
jgi:nucleotide-binding universal stress UspA family protein